MRCAVVVLMYVSEPSAAPAFDAFDAWEAQAGCLCISVSVTETAALPHWEACPRLELFKTTDTGFCMRGIAHLSRQYGGGCYLAFVLRLSRIFKVKRSRVPYIGASLHVSW